MTTARAEHDETSSVGIMYLICYLRYLPPRLRGGRNAFQTLEKKLVYSTSRGKHIPTGSCESGFLLDAGIATIFTRCFGGRGSDGVDASGMPTLASTVKRVFSAAKEWLYLRCLRALFLTCFCEKVVLFSRGREDDYRPASLLPHTTALYCGDSISFRPLHRQYRRAVGSPTTIPPASSAGCGTHPPHALFIPSRRTDL